MCYNKHISAGATMPKQRVIDAFSKVHASVFLRGNDTYSDAGRVIRLRMINAFRHSLIYDLTLFSSIWLLMREGPHSAIAVDVMDAVMREAGVKSIDELILLTRDG